MAFVFPIGVLGVAMFLSILAHELPHEIADFAILVQHGCTATEAIWLQFCTAVFAFVGTGVGLLSNTHENANATILGLVSGGFLYLSTVTIMPELLNHGSAGDQKKSWATMMSQTSLEVAAFSAGVGMMVLVARFEPHGHGH